MATRETDSGPIDSGPFYVTRQIFDVLSSKLDEAETKINVWFPEAYEPAAASFNLFQNEFDRGRKFNTVVQKILR